MILDSYLMEGLSFHVYFSNLLSLRISPKMEGAREGPYVNTPKWRQERVLENMIYIMVHVQPHTRMW